MPPALSKKSRRKKSATPRTITRVSEAIPLRPRVTLRDIAEKLGISRMTVSLALRDDPNVAKATKRKVLAVARKLGFSQDSRVSKLMSELAHLRRTPHYMGELAFLTSWQTEFGWKSSYHFSGCLQGARKRALELGYQLNPYWTRDPMFVGKGLSRVLWARGVRGILVAPLGPEMIGFPNAGLNVDWKRFCVLQLGVTLTRPQINLVRHNHFHGMAYSLRMLEALGYRRIGFAIVEAGDLLTSRLWKAAYLHWRTQRGLQNDLPGFVYPHDALAEDRLRDWIRDFAIEAVITMDVSPHPILKRVEKTLGRHVGFSVLDHPGGKSPICGIEQNAPEIGRGAVDQLVHAIHHNLTGVPAHPAQTLLQGRWHQGTTARRLSDRKPLRPMDSIDLMVSTF